ncbi:hypothetical protein GCM10010492_01640 [Saccharothrix mutabilis subsp. mutabilis]|uniref:Uncharacterized protein n=1 Tax=Saccharothrix mutabilis subsp. mutabilis TaxID=66855 RepID=A0ABP3CJN6_9PSEU
MKATAADAPGCSAPTWAVPTALAPRKKVAADGALPALWTPEGGNFLVNGVGWPTYARRHGRWEAVRGSAGGVRGGGGGLARPAAAPDRRGLGAAGGRAG